MMKRRISKRCERVYGSRDKSLQGFTLIEIITVVAIIGIGAGLFYSLFLMGWSAFDSELTRVNLWQELTEIIQQVSFDARAAQSMNFVDDKEITFSFFDGNSTTYKITLDGEFQQIRGGNTTVFSYNVAYNNSSFGRVGDSLKMNLTLVERTLRGEVVARTSTKICPRNIWW